MGCSTVGSEVSPGIKGADFVFYVSALKTERCNKGLTVAYAAHCQQESALDRLINSNNSIQFLIFDRNCVYFEFSLTVRKEGGVVQFRAEKFCQSLMFLSSLFV